MPRPPTVRTRTGDCVIPTCLPAAPDKNPMFLDKRVYQGSSGRIYPLPFTDRIGRKRANRKWKAIWIENEYLRVMVLPELGGRIHVLQDKTNGYDLIYNQNVIKPALVGLAGPWISGGIEFNWPQHHRPGTFLPVDYEIEEHAEGSKTVWCSDHDPFSRMKGMHGVCLHPGRAVLELKVRLHNRTPFVQTFLWWANAAMRVHEDYQSFFPPDVYYVADHARRSMSEYPLANGCYYGVDYGARARSGIPPDQIPKQFIPAHCRSKPAIHSSRSNVPDYAANDLSFYANIPTPCSYMCVQSKEDFFGGYDYKAQAGILHIANHHISPGKKQWTWGNHDFGYAWDRHLTDPDEQGVCRPYIELMAGVYTDNQPDFSFLQPGETKSWSQYWYPLQKIGPAQHANLHGAVSLTIHGSDAKPPRPPKNRNNVRLGVFVTRKFPGATIELAARGKAFLSTRRDLSPDRPFVDRIKKPENVREQDLVLRVSDQSGREIISYRPVPRTKAAVPLPATEPAAPADMTGNDELFITGLHLDQYRHATRCPTSYWREALRRDPLDSRCNNAMGLWHLKRGEFADAEAFFRKAVQRLALHNANPCDGEPLYNLGLCLRFQLAARRDRQSAIHDPGFEQAYSAFYKATWNQAWVAAGCRALAEMDCLRCDWHGALEHLDRALRHDVDNLRARDLKTMVLRKLLRHAEADKLLGETLALDPLDWWARHLRGRDIKCDSQTRLDLAHDFARAGFYAEAIQLLEGCSAETRDLPDPNWGARPMTFYTLGWLHEKSADKKAAMKSYRRAAAESPDYCFPARLEEILILESAMEANPRDPRAPYYLGNLLYARCRREDAMKLWQCSAKGGPDFSIVWRNLGIGWFNTRQNPAKARTAYNRAFRANPADARVLFERDHLWKWTGERPKRRLRELEKHPRLVSRRDDLSVELCALYNQTGRHAKALDILMNRNFQPWEGGEGAVLSQYVRTRLALGRKMLARAGAASRNGVMERPGSQARPPAAVACEHFEAALNPPPNLGEAWHLLSNPAEIHYWLGNALELLGQTKSARGHWLAAARSSGDFQQMSVRAFSEMTLYCALSLKKLGRRAAARNLLHALLAYAVKLQTAPAKIDYFATSLPTMLLFGVDLQFHQETTALFLQAQAQLGLGNEPAAGKLLSSVLRRDPNHSLAADLWRDYFQQDHTP